MADSTGAIRVLIAAGGTGGHLYPGIAIAEEWMRLHPDSKVVFVGTSRGPETKAVPRAGFALETIAARGLPRQPGLGLIRAAIGLVASLWQSFRLIVDLKPHVVVGTGSYVSAPVVLVARLFGIPVIIQEQNSIPGATNRWLNLISTEVHISFLESRGYFRRKNNLRVSGNPIRRSLLMQDRAGAYETFGLDPAKRTLFVFGGSRGAASINKATEGALERLKGTQVQILWQTGTEDFEAIERRFRDFPIKVRVFAYLDAIEKAYAIADLAVCRAGAMTIAEVTACGIPSILVPYPHATRDHQTHNARGLVERDAAEVIADKDLTPEILAGKISALLRDEARLRRLARNARAFARVDAASRIARSMEQLVHASPIPHES
ncbi:MAG TPA: undecaprenyldiphospho-muramoylpentapeptide beta-N-acetylglucosaminyltransferase [Candidatus Limnocylindrales bacterium]|nr:undecaprenyldiphospho-muramoylpentapeptide beta-N-acetylglucosaminyltransferase [Candidatus Limnocylindrales bacterium]